MPQQVVLGSLRVIYEADLSQLRASKIEAGRIMVETGRVLQKGSAGLSKSLREIQVGANQVAKAFGVMVAPLIASGGLALKWTIDFERELRNVNSIAHLGEEGLRDLSDRIRELARDETKTTEDAISLAKAFYIIQGSGFSAAESIDDAMKILEVSTRAATAGLTTTEVAATALTASLLAYGRGAESAGEFSDVLFKTVDIGTSTFEALSGSIGMALGSAKSLGVSFKELNAAEATLSKVGFTAAEAYVSLNRLFVELLRPSENLKKSLKDIGFSSGAAAVEQLGLIGTLEKLYESVGKNERAFGDLFPEIRANRAALGLLHGEFEDAKKDLDAVSRATEGAGATQRAFEEQTKSTYEQLKMLRSNVVDLALDLGETLLPYLKDAIDRVQSWVDAWRAMPEDERKKWIDFVLNVGKALIALSTISKVISILAGVGGAINKIAGAGKGLAEGGILVKIGSALAGMATSSASLIAVMGILGSLFGFAGAKALGFKGGIEDALIVFRDLGKVMVAWPTEKLRDIGVISDDVAKRIAAFLTTGDLSNLWKDNAAAASKARDEFYRLGLTYRSMQDSTERLKEQLEIATKAVEDQQEKYSEAENYLKSYGEALGKVPESAEEARNLIEALSEGVRLQAIAADDAIPLLLQLASAYPELASAAGEALSKMVPDEDMKEKVSGTLEKILEARKEHLEEIRDLQEEYQQDEARRLEDHLRDLQEKEYNYHQEVTDENREYQSRLAEIEYDYQSRLRDIIYNAQQERVDARRDYHDKMEDLEHDFHERMVELESEHQERLASLQEEFEERQRDLHSSHLEEMASLDERYQERLGSLAERKEELEEEKQEASRRGDWEELERIRRREARLEKEEKRIREEWARRKAIEEEEYQARVAEEEARYAEQVAKEEERYQQERARRQEEYEYQRKEIKEAYEQRLAEIAENEARQRALLEAETAHRRELLRAEHEQKLADLAESYAHERALAEENYALDRQRRAEDHAQELADLEAKNDQRLQELATELARELGLSQEKVPEIVSIFRQGAEEINSALSSVGQGFEGRLNTLRAQVSEWVNDLQKRLDDLRRSMERVREAARGAGTSVPGRQAGGYAFGGLYRLGERGREFVLSAETTRNLEAVLGGLNQAKLNWLGGLAGLLGRVPSAPATIGGPVHLDFQAQVPVRVFIDGEEITARTEHRIYGRLLRKAGAPMGVA